MTCTHLLPALLVGLGCSAATAAVAHVGQCFTRADVTHRAQQLCSTTPVSEALWTVGLRDSDPLANKPQVQRLLQQHGLQSTLDLRLVGGLEAEQLIEQLRLDGVTIGDRSKVRLLLQEDHRDHHAPQWSELEDSKQIRAAASLAGALATGGGSRRALQAADGLSADTIAIVLSVLVGAVGYLVQAQTARQADHSAAERAQEQHTAEQKLAR